MSSAGHKHNVSQGGTGVANIPEDNVMVGQGKAPVEMKALTEFVLDGGEVNQYLDFASVAVPDPPAAGFIRLFGADERGFEVLEYLNSEGDLFRIGEDTYRIARNTTGAQIDKGEVVYFSGSTGNAPNVGLAKADAETTMPATGAAYRDVANNDFGIFLVTGAIEDIDTSAFSEGDELYVSSATAGALTATQPVHPNYLQSIGTVEVSGVGNGKILFNIAPFKGGQESGTRRNNFTIGDQASGAKTLKFDNGSILTLSGNPTGTRTHTLPDATGTYPLLESLNAFSGGIFSASVVIADDGVAVMAAGSTNNFGLLFIKSSRAGSNDPEGVVGWRSVGTQAPVGIALTNATDIEFTTGVLTGTTGTDGKCTFSAADENIYIENRLNKAISLGVLVQARTDAVSFS